MGQKGGQRYHHDVNVVAAVVGKKYVSK